MDIFQAAHEGNIARTRTLLSEHICINQVNAHGQSPLHIASQTGRLKLVEYLLKHNANVKLKDLYGRTALHYATLYDHIHITEQLLERAANPNEQDDFGFSPLHLALKLPRKKHPPLIALALEKKKYAIIKLLLQYGAHPNLPIQFNTRITCLCLGQMLTPYHSYTPLIYALKQEQIIQYTSLIRLLLAYGASKEFKACDGTTALRLVTHMKDFPLWYMIQYPLHNSIAANDSFCVKMLLEKYSPQTLDNFGKPAFILAIHDSEVDKMLRLPTYKS